MWCPVLFHLYIWIDVLGHPRTFGSTNGCLMTNCFETLERQLCQHPPGAYCIIEYPDTSFLNQAAHWLIHVVCLAERPEEIPDFVFLAHCIDVLSSLHVSFCIRTLAAYPYVCHWFLWFMWPVTTFALFFFWTWGQTFVAYKYYLNKLRCMTWVIPRHGFQVQSFSSCLPLHAHS